jgi:hypothetical protein
MEQEEAAIARQRHGKYVSAATNQRATIEELLERCFLCGRRQAYSKVSV